MGATLAVECGAWQYLAVAHHLLASVGPARNLAEQARLVASQPAPC